MDEQKYYEKEVWDAANNIDILQLVLASPAINVKRINGRYTARCFSGKHNDSHASLYINDLAHGNYIYCFGCQTTWHPVQFIQWERNCSPVEALQILIASYPQNFVGLDVSSSVPSKRWKGLSFKDLEKIGLGATFYFSDDKGNSDSISMRDLALKAPDFYASVINNAIAKKYLELQKIKAANAGSNPLVTEGIITSIEEMEKIKGKIGLTY